MTATMTTLPTQTAAPPSLAIVTEAAHGFLDALTLCGLDDSRWGTVGRLVSPAALRLREAIGAPLAGSSAAAPPIVRERDLATAARYLLRPETNVQDAHAAHEFVTLALEARLALS